MPICLLCRFTMACNGFLFFSLTVWFSFSSLPLSSLQTFNLIDLYVCSLVGAIWFRFRRFSLIGLDCGCLLLYFSLPLLCSSLLWVYDCDYVLHFFRFMIVIVTLWIIRLSVIFDLISLGFSFRPEVTRRLWRAQPIVRLETGPLFIHLIQ